MVLHYGLVRLNCSDHPFCTIGRDSQHILVTDYQYSVIVLLILAINVDALRA